MMKNEGTALSAGGARVACLLSSLMSAIGLSGVA